MDFNKELILNRTHYGITIYAHILKQYYPSETVLSLSGRDCKPTKNPFNQNKPSLLIKILNGCALFLDTVDDLLCGDPFDFAELHYKIKGSKLLQKLNSEMNLRLELNDGFYKDRPEPLGLFWEGREEFEPPVFSYFSKPVSNIYPKKKIDLVDLYNEIKGSRYIERTEELRKIKNPKEARKFKASQFDYVTFSGTFSKRTDKELIEHSSLLTIDFDHIQDVEELRNKLLSDEYFETEMLFISPSGDGLKWIIPIDLTEANHQEYFKAVSNYIQSTYGLEVDQSGKDISRACFLPHDLNVYLNPKYY
jgi:hypothetical protein